MKVFAISGSPRPTSFTERMLDAFLEGMGEGHEIQRCYPNRMKISYCMGCFNCWTATKGVCSIQDDMRKILPLIDGADVLIAAAPLYVDGFPACVKNIFERILPLLSGAITVDAHGHSRHPRRHPKEQKAILISSCGFPEADNFNHLIGHFNAICKNADMQMAGNVLISAAGAAAVPAVGRKLDVVKKAGESFARNGEVAKELEEELLKEVINPTLYRSLATANYEGPMESLRSSFREIYLKGKKVLEDF